MSGPERISGTVEDLLENVLFADPDPRVQRLKRLWQEAKREAAELMTAADEQNYRVRLEFHLTREELQPEELAKADASVLHILTREEYDERLLVIWNDINRRLSAVMEELKAERQESPQDAPRGEGEGTDHEE